MGIFDWFGGKSKFERHAARVANKRAQTPDRWESILYLRKQGTAEAAEALLQRFRFRIDPSITDQEEKEAALEGIVAAGQAAVEPVRRFLRRADSIAWPMKCLERLLPEDEVTAELIALLESMDTEYERDPDKKLQVLAALEERRDPRIGPAVLRFLEDVNEAARFHAVSTLLSQLPPARQAEGDAPSTTDGDGPSESEVAEALASLLEREESVRVRSRVLDAFAQRGWSLGKRAEALRPRLPAGYALDAEGRVHKK